VTFLRPHSMQLVPLNTCLRFYTWINFLKFLLLSYPLCVASEKKPNKKIFFFFPFPNAFSSFSAVSCCVIAIDVDRKSSLFWYIFPIYFVDAFFFLEWERQCLASHFCRVICFYVSFS